MQKRVLTAVVGLPVLFGLLYLGGYFLFVACLVLSGVALIEFSNAFNRQLENKDVYKRQALFIEGFWKNGFDAGTGNRDLIWTKGA